MCYYALPPAKIVEVFGRTGISLDPDFTVKTLRGMLGEMERNPDRFAGKRVLFLHTGMYLQWPTRFRSAGTLPVYLYFVTLFTESQTSTGNAAQRRLVNVVCNHVNSYLTTWHSLLTLAFLLLLLQVGSTVSLMGG